MEKKFKLGFGFWLALISFAIVGVLIWAGSAGNKSKNNKLVESTSREVALTCTTDMATQFHIHPVLKIIIFGVEQNIPANIGINETCMNSIHTHTADGVIHIESPVKKDFTLGDFFAVWKKPFSQAEFLDTRISSGDEIFVSVNGEIVDTFDQTIFHDKDKIVIEVRKINDGKN